ncbi:MAG TPA: Dyp-type peroxidase [Thermoanaerobaculia bacterium]
METPQAFDPDSDVITGPEIPGAPVEPVLDADEIQGNILPGFGSRHQVLLGLKVVEGRIAEAKSWLARLVPSIARLRDVNAVRNLRRSLLRRQAALPAAPSAPWINIAFSIGGLRLLTTDADAIRDPSFRKGMALLSGSLGDPTRPEQEGHPSRWVVGGAAETTPDVLLILGASDACQLRDLAEGLRMSLAGVPASGLRTIYDQEAFVLDGEKEHFGFRDGVSQVAARGRLSDLPLHFLTRRYIDPADPRALTHGKPGQPLVWPGQFVFGYPTQQDDEGGPGPIADGGPDWMRNGSFLVFRRLRQDVAAFRAFLREQVAELVRQAPFAEMTEARLAALLVGRWPSGAPLMRSPERDDPAMVDDSFAINHFQFNDPADPVAVLAEAGASPRLVAGAPADVLGHVCPRFSHIRKVNPRDLPTDQGGAFDQTLTFQVLRRGITWGDPFPQDEGAADPADGQRGLLFLCYQTSIRGQFEVLNNKWMNRRNGPQDGGHDLLVGQNHAPAAGRECLLRTSQGEATLKTMADWVIPTGGGYFFAPSISALRGLVGQEGPVGA